MYLPNMLPVKITIWLIFCESRQQEGEYYVSNVVVKYEIKIQDCRQCHNWTNIKIL